MSANNETITARDYTRLCELIYREAGITLGPGKQTMIESRIKRRVKALALGSYAEYCDYLFGRQGLKDEIVPLIDAVTTNKTDFFRESRHFEFLTASALPDLVARNRLSRPLLFWSAGCSTGEEPYTLAIVLSEYAEKHPGFRFRILATDISTSVLAKADRGVFSTDTIGPVPALLKRKYFLRSRNAASDLVRVVPELRRHVEFRRLNFMDADYGVQEEVDGIFCRNVMIYFDRPTQERILGNLASHLAPQGYMFVGHSETLHDMRLPLVPIGPALYRRVDAA